MVVNAIPLLGVWLWSWNAFQIVGLYWFETVVLGIINVLKMACASRRSPDGGEKSGRKFFLIPFFCIHYGMFTFVHGLFIVHLFSDKPSRLGESASFAGSSGLLPAIGEEGGLWFMIAIFASHLHSMIKDYLWTGSFRNTRAAELMGPPYRRIMILHLAVLGGAFLVSRLGNSAYLLTALIIVKTGADLRVENQTPAAN